MKCNNIKFLLDSFYVYRSEIAWRQPVIMAPIRLPCLVGGECTFQTVQLEYEQAKAQQDGHMQYAHGAVEENTALWEG